jgi:hypothetical protein
LGRFQEHADILAAGGRKRGCHDERIVFGLKEFGERQGSVLARRLP